MSDLSERTIQRAIEEIDINGFACIPDLLKVIQSLTANLQSLSVHRLSDLIKNDTAVMAKMFASANTVGYHPTGDPVTTIHDAIQVIGFDRLRSLVLSLILLENSRVRSTSEFEKKAVAESLCAGMIAQALAPELGLAKTENAFVAASLRGFGLIVLATYFTDQVVEVHSLDNKQSFDARYLEVLGITPVDLSITLLEHMGMGKIFLQTLKGFSGVGETARFKQDYLFAELVEASGKLSQVIVDPTLDATDFEAQLQAISKKHLKNLPRLYDLIPGALNTSERHLHDLIRGIGSTQIGSEHLQCISSRAKGQSPEKAILLKRVSKATDKWQKSDITELSPSQEQVTKREKIAVKAIEAATDEVREMALTLNSADPRIASRRLIKVVSDFLGSTECWCFLPSAGKKSYLLYESIGTQAFGLQGRVSISTNERTVFGVCLQRGENVLIKNAREKGIRRSLPRWFVGNVDLGAFLLMPLVSDEKRFGLIFVGWSASKGSEQITTRHYKLLKNFFQSLLS